MHTLDRHFRDLTKAAFAKYGFAYADVLAQWPAIVGLEVAGICRPVRLKASRGETEAGTLTVSAAPGFGLEVAHATDQIIERINGFLGYGAISKIKVVNEVEPRKPGAKSAAVETPRKTDAVAGFADDNLRQALERLGASAGAFPQR